MILISVHASVPLKQEVACIVLSLQDCVQSIIPVCICATCACKGFRKPHEGNELAHARACVYFSDFARDYAFEDRSGRFRSQRLINLDRAHFQFCHSFVFPMAFTHLLLFSFVFLFLSFFLTICRSPFDSAFFFSVCSFVILFARPLVCLSARLS